MITFSKKEIGIIGETLPPQNEFFNIINLNKIKHNFEVFDFIARRREEDDWYLFSVKARSKYTNGKLNPKYNILTKNNSIKFKKAIERLHENGFHGKFRYCFLIAPLEENKDCIYYWGEFTEIKPECTEYNILKNNVKYLGVPVKELNYKIFGFHTWDTIVRGIECMY
jgi:hypothetical protein